MCSSLHEETRVWESASQLAAWDMISGLIIRHLLLNMVFSFCCVFCRFDHCSSNCCKLPTSISLCCKGELSYKHTASFSQLSWAAGAVIGWAVERQFAGGRTMLLTCKSASGYSLNPRATLPRCPPPDLLSISVTKLSLKLLIKLVKLTFLC